MGFIKRVLGYATIGAAKESAREAWESRDHIESAFRAAETGILGEAAYYLLEDELGSEEEEEDQFFSDY